MFSKFFIFRLFQIIFLTCFVFSEAHAQIDLNSSSEFYIGDKISFHIDDSSIVSFDTINWQVSEDQVPNFGINSKYIFLKLDLFNSSSNSITKYLYIDNPLLDEVSLIKNDSIVLTQGENFPFYDRVGTNPGFIFPIEFIKSSKEQIILRIKSSEQIILPISIHEKEKVDKEKNFSWIVGGAFLGVLIIMILYNSLLFLFTKDWSYFYYVGYVLFMGLTQLGIKGFSFFAFWPDYPQFHQTSLIVFANLAGIFCLFFTIQFLSIKSWNKSIYKLMNVLNGLFLLSIVLLFIDQSASFGLMQLSTSILSILLIVSSIIGLKKNVLSAKFFVFAWITLVLGAIVFLLKDFGVLPFNELTNNAMLLASTIEMALLSFALADKINHTKKEKELFFKNQNVILERTVDERTKELKSAQAQIVQNEKMASLGQLTAGVAHEINNPLAFIRGSLKPLERDFQDMVEVLRKTIDLKSTEDKIGELEKVFKEIEDMDLTYSIEEAEELIKSIEEGTHRTQEIVDSLKTFSRHDEADIKKYNLNEGVKSTLQILKSKLSGIKTNEDFGDIPLIECYGGKLNQVFMNLLTNSIDAVQETNSVDGEISIVTKEEEGYIVLEFSDNGSGMSEKTKQKLFDPFYTTKDVGKGTGLGMSITLGIIEQHKGEIEVFSDIGQGTKFIIRLPIHAD